MVRMFCLILLVSDLISAAYAASYRFVVLHIVFASHVFVALNGVSKTVPSGFCDSFVHRNASIVYEHPVLLGFPFIHHFALHVLKYLGNV